MCFRVSEYFLLESKLKSISSEIALKLRPARGRKWRKKRKSKNKLQGRSQQVIPIPPMSETESFGGFSFDSNLFGPVSGPSDWAAVDNEIFNTDFNPFN